MQLDLVRVYFPAALRCPEKAVSEGVFWAKSSPFGCSGRATRNINSDDFVIRTPAV